MRDRLIPVRMTVMKKTVTNADENAETKERLNTVSGNVETCTAIVENSMEVPEHTKNRTTI